MAIWHGQLPTGFTNFTVGPRAEGFRIPPIPDDGWVSQILIAYDSSNSQSQLGNFGIWGPDGQALYAGPRETFPTSRTNESQARAVQRTHVLGTPLRVTAGMQLYPGVQHEENMGFVGDISNLTPGAGNNWYALNWTGGIPSDIIPGNVSYLPNIQIVVLYQQQIIPSRPVWISPTPANNGTTTDPSPELRWTIPHIEAEDDTVLTDLELTVLNTNTFYHWTFGVNTAQNNDGHISWSPLTFAPGDILSMRVRHQDTWGDWSEWSDTRVFSIFDAPPGKGVWQSPTPAEGALVTDSTPTLRGSTPHPFADSAYDWTVAYQVQIADAQTNIIIQDFIDVTDAAERAGDYFEHTLGLGLPSNTDCKARFRHHDRKGTWSEWSDYRSFTMSAGPDLPTISRPKGKVNYRNETEYQAGGGVGSLYSGSYNNVSGTAMHSVRIEIWNADGTARLYDSGWVARTATAGVWTLPQASFPGHPAALAWATSYKIRANVAETSGGLRGIESGWGEFADVRTNSFPDRPHALSPSDGIPSATLQFSAAVTDVDGDAITQAEMVIKRVDTNALVGTYPMDVSGNTLTKTLSGGILTLGVEYQWYCRARDATGWGEYSFVEPFVYASVPTVTNLAPRAAERVNMVRDPSAEYNAAVEEDNPFWSVLNGDQDNIIERTGDDSLYGEMSWKATTTATNSLTLRSEKIAIDATKPWLLQAEFKKLSGTSITRFRLRCLTSADALISTITPTSFGNANGVNLPSTFTRYGGIVWPIGSSNTPAFPATTAKVEIEILPSNNSVAEVFFDGVAFEQVYNTTWTSGQWLEVQKWYGYFDGDTEGHDTTIDTYFWAGQQGITASTGASILTSTGGKVYFQFDHNTNMQDRRLLVDRYSDVQKAWVQIYDSGFIALVATPGSKVAMDLPPAIIKNDDRYRFRIQARDGLGISGEGAGTAADTDYIGQPEPIITSISSDVSKAEVVLEWTATDLAGASFAGYEIARVERDGGSLGAYTILYREMNRDVTRFTDPYPLSDTNYIYLVRVVELVGVYEEQGRWGRGSMNINYFPHSFIKDAEDPQNLYVAYETPIDNLGTPEEDAIQQVVMPWGQSRPTVLTRADMRLRSGTISANFYNAAQFVEDAATRYKTLQTILNRRNSICILTQEPDKERIFASVMGPWERSMPFINVRAIEFNYQENGYREDLRDREDSG